MNGKTTKKLLNEEFVVPKARVRLTPGQVVKYLREQMQWTQGDLAKKTGLKQTTISAIEHDRATLGVDRARVLAKAFNVHPGLLAFPDWEFKAA